LSDRLELLGRYPELVSMRPFYLPIYRTSPRPVWMLWTGIKVYDALAGRHNVYRSGRVSRKQFAREFSALKQNGVRAVLRYYDGKTNDLALTKRVAKDAEEMGCVFCEGVDVRDVGWDERGFVVTVGDQVFKSLRLVNATGPWIDEVTDRYNLPAEFQIRKVSGIHVFVDGLLTPDPMFLQTGGKRIFFIIPEPENGQTMIGTTEREETVSIDEVTVQEEDVDYLIREVNQYLVSDRQIQQVDIKGAIVGVRPLVAKKADPTDLSREYELDLHSRGETQLLNVFGGKLTTYLSLSRQVAQMLGVKEGETTALRA
ncbi:MAG: FAD-dependent oxidoreductase, partial [Candidatus Latescibacteria bacterium]|nr:FAD-dependent oxidoreductase [Candidatus Latescibacterota bacterium]